MWLAVLKLQNSRRAGRKDGHRRRPKKEKMPRLALVDLDKQGKAEDLEKNLRQ
jgi:hypothetical protein